MTQQFAHGRVLAIGTELFRKSGASDSEASTAAGALVESSLMGHDSHGVLRIPSYLDMITDGSVVPGAPITVERTSDTTAIVDCGMNFGAVGGQRALDLEDVRLPDEELVVRREARHAVRCPAIRSNSEMVP